MYVCLCKAVTDRQIDAAIEDGATTLEALQACTRAGTKCGGCKPLLRKRIAAATIGLEEPVAASGIGIATGTYRLGRPAAIAAAPMAV